MKSFWLMLLEKAIASLLQNHWDDVVHQVTRLTHVDVPGEEKRVAAYKMLRSLGVNCATWLLYAAIEIAYGRLKEVK